MIVCLCKAVSDREIVTAIGEGHVTVKALARKCGAGTGQNCGGCREALRSLLKEHGCTACDDKTPRLELASVVPSR